MSVLNKWIPIFFIVIGIFAIILALIADLIPILETPGFGSSQLLVLIAGIIITVLGIIAKVRWGK